MATYQDIDELLDGVVTLPSLPASVARIVQLVNNPDTSLDEVAKAISMDPSIALKTLRLVNSAFYGLPNKISSVDHAVVMLGIKVVKNLVFSATVFDTLKGGADTMFRHSVHCGAAMRVLVETCGVAGLAIDSAEEGFVYGLLHDIGKVLLHDHMPVAVQEVREVAVSREVPTWQAEREVIGVDHAELGARLAEKWKLPDPLVQAIAGHHVPGHSEDDGGRRLAGLLSVADYCCVASGLTADGAEHAILTDDAWTVSGLSKNQLPAILDAFFKTLPDVAELIQLAA